MPDKIYSYADKSWPVVKGCRNDLPCAGKCWAARECHRLADNPNPKIADFHAGLTDAHGHWTGTVKLNEAHLTDPLRWRKPAVIATAYHGDLFLAPYEDIVHVFGVMCAANWHKYLLLTKRPKLALEFIERFLREGSSFPTRNAMDMAVIGLGVKLRKSSFQCPVQPWPLRNVWLGVSVTNQADADERIPLLLKTPAAHRWVSIEPMVGAVDLGRYLPEPTVECANCGNQQANMGRGVECEECGDPMPNGRQEGIDWVVLGGESGPNARPMHPDWARRVRDDCKAAGVPYFHKQNGEWMPTAEVGFGGREHLPTHTFSYGDGTGTEMIRVGKKAAGNLLDGCLHNEMPEGLRV